MMHSLPQAHAIRSRLAVTTSARPAVSSPRRTATPSRDTSPGPISIVASTGSKLPNGIGSTIMTGVSPNVAAVNDLLSALDDRSSDSAYTEQATHCAQQGYVALFVANTPGVEGDREQRRGQYGENKSERVHVRCSLCEGKGW